MRVAPPVEAEQERPSQSAMVLPPPPDCADDTVEVVVPRLPPLGKIRQYENALAAWSPALAAAQSHLTDIDDLAPPPHDEDASPSATRLTSRSRASSRSRRRAA